MDDYRIAVEESQLLEFMKLFSCQFINSFACMNYESAPVRRGRTRFAKVAAEGRRMSPAVVLDYSYREVRALQRRPTRIVVADCCHTAEKIAYSTPPKAYIFRHRTMPCNQF
jgi:hypothetical protein